MFFEEYELVTAMPISFTIDGEESVKDPRGLTGSAINTRVVVSSSPKESLYRILSVLKLAGLEVVDICYSSFGDYYALSNKSDDSLVGAIINIGEDSTNISVFNRGIIFMSFGNFIEAWTIPKVFYRLYECTGAVTR